MLRENNYIALQKVGKVINPLLTLISRPTSHSSTSPSQSLLAIIFRISSAFFGIPESLFLTSRVRSPATAYR